MLTVAYEPGTTFKELTSTSEAKKLLDDYCSKPIGIPAERWKEHTLDAREILSNNSSKVRIFGEIQIVLQYFSEIRHQMHEPYKVWRAGNAQQLYDDFVNTMGVVSTQEPAKSVYNAISGNRN